MRKWIIKKRDDAAVRAVIEQTSLGGLISGVLASRGITDPGKFLNAPEIFDPFLMKDMDKCVNIIGNALQKGEHITVFGDYDCDGITAAVMLHNYLTALGGEVDWYIPSRDEGYGLNSNAVEKIADNGTELIITVDNGISARKEAELIKEKGIKLIITDHHQPPAVLPEADAIINPHRKDDNYPFKHLAGCGVVLKLIMALENDVDNVMEQFGDLAAIGTIGDIVPLIGENRFITQRGLQTLPFTENPGLYQLLRYTGLGEGEDITATETAFKICPRINAAGRMSHAREAAELLLSEQNEQAAMLAKRLSELNSERQAAEAEIIRNVEAEFTAHPECLYERVLVCAGENFHHGIIGIVSARLLLKYDKPCIVISVEGETARGSARSIEGFPLHELLAFCDDLLLKYGGHAKAAGFSLKTASLPDFYSRVREYTREKYFEMPVNTITADFEPMDFEITVENVEQLSILEPFGEENKPPLFLLKNVEIISKKPLKDGKYLSFTVRYGNLEQKLLNFNSTYDNFLYNPGDKVDVLISLGINEYNNTKIVSAQVKDIRRADFPEEKYFNAASAYEKLRRGEKLNSKLENRIMPEMTAIKSVYDILKTTDNFAKARDMALKKGLNYCMFCVILDLLSEFRLINRDIISDKLTFVPGAAKADFGTSDILKKYKMCFTD